MGETRREVKAVIKAALVRMMGLLPTLRLCSIAGRLVTTIWPGFRGA